MLCFTALLGVSATTPTPVANCDASVDAGFGVTVNGWEVNGEPCATHASLAASDEALTTLTVDLSWVNSRMQECHRISLTDCNKQLYVGVDGSDLKCLWSGYPHKANGTTRVALSVGPGSWKIVAAAGESGCVTKTTGATLFDVDVKTSE